MRRVLVVMMYMLEPREGRRTLDLICLGSLSPSLALWLFLKRKESISLFSSRYFCFLRSYSRRRLSLISCLIES
jgi:hypothetical protein